VNDLDILILVLSVVIWCQYKSSRAGILLLFFVIIPCQLLPSRLWVACLVVIIPCKLLPSRLWFACLGCLLCTQSD